MGLETLQPEEAKQRLDQIFDRAKGLGGLCTKRSFSRAGYHFETPWTSIAPTDQYGGKGLETSLRLKKSLCTVHGQEKLDRLAIQSSLSDDLYFDNTTERIDSKKPGLLTVINNRVAYVSLYDGRREPTYVTPHEALLIPRVEEILDLTERAFDQA